MLEALLNELKKRFGKRLVSLVVFGSVARGTMKSDSDLDLLIVAQGLPRGRIRRGLLFYEIEEALAPLLEKVGALWKVRVCFSPILKTPEEAQRIVPLYLDLVEDAVLVFDRNEFFETVLRRLKQWLQELGAQRVWMGRKWYWVLKPEFEFGEVIELE